MTGFEILDLVIGMIFVYFLTSLMCVSVQEALARFRKLRMVNLKKWLTDTFNTSEAGKNLGDRIWCNVIVDGLTQASRGASYLSQNVFVHALLDEIHYGTAGEAKKGQAYAAKAPYDFNTLKMSIKASELLPEPIKRMLLQFHHESFSNLDTFKLKIGKWFDEAMERNAGTYKKKAQDSVLIISFALTILLNVDSVRLFDYFYENKDQAAKVADAAQAMIKDTQVIERIHHLQNDTTTKADRKILDQLETDLTELRKHHEKLTQLGIPIGWNFIKDEKEHLTEFLFWFLKVLGWIVTGIAVSLGAPFWFDILNKLVNLRSAGKKPDDSKSASTATTSATETALA